MTDQPPALSRRDRLRAQTFQEIEDSSFAIIDAEGVHALTIAALARSMAMSAPAVYRYFTSRDALLAHLITVSYEQLTAAMSQAAEGGRRAPRTRVGLLVAAYREWALRHRRRYGMLFADRTDGVLAEGDERTPLHQGMALLVDLLVTIQNAAPGGTTSGDRALDGQLRLWAGAQRMPETTPAASAAAILIWTRVHGIVSLELAGVFENATIEAQRLIDLEIDNAIRPLTAAS
ncbi:TetR/AcrR family transcriptional regulator [Umezawaea endophytica]|uniref:TetR/AcrR family transcriptional regulator n=1 Tax=Umezawaea endophytica TaxID=1654476 RepID=A0A9X2ZZR8_9PSEU|nr:TetR/AcrR family transcriptional regulator [Umezawaea endophytica]MCS7477764.1 TetR/AcrR family transcriptional regulator [Umezawaea endophytica]